jgi:hypothetical protein
MSKEAAVKCLRDDYPGASTQQMTRVITDALKSARKEIRSAIATASKREIEDVSDPIPNLQPDWRAEIGIGYATATDEGKLTFKLYEEMI